MDFNAIPIGSHVVAPEIVGLESGIFLTCIHQFQYEVMLHHSIETEEMMELSTSTASTVQ